jgi:hypothetical protein
MRRALHATLEAQRSPCPTLRHLRGNSSPCIFNMVQGGRSSDAGQDRQGKTVVTDLCMRHWRSKARGLDRDQRMRMHEVKAFATPRHAAVRRNASRVRPQSKSRGSWAAGPTKGQSLLSADKMFFQLQ